MVNNLGLLYTNQGKMVEAEAMYRRALKGYEKVWGPEHTSTLNTVNNLGLLYKDQGKMVEAEAMYRRALEGKEKAWGPEHTSTRLAEFDKDIVWTGSDEIVLRLNILRALISKLIPLGQDNHKPAGLVNLSESFRGCESQALETYGLAITAKLETLTQELELTNASSISIVDYSAQSVGNTLQSIVEDTFRETWDCWPLATRMEDLKPGQARIYWDCVSTAK